MKIETTLSWSLFDSFTIFVNNALFADFADTGLVTAAVVI